MNSYDFFFEHTGQSEKLFLVGKEEISFSKLAELTGNIAEKLNDTIGNRKNILLISPNNLFFIKAYLAILKSGNICIPIDPNIEANNLKSIVEIAMPILVFAFTPTKTGELFPNLKCITPEVLQEFEMHKTSNKIEESFNQEDCAEIIFTSGSTGKPKGVMISHKNLISNTQSIVQYLGLSSNDRILVVLPFYYCYGLSLLHTHLRAGGSIVLNNSFVFIGAILNNLISYKCTGFSGVPSHFQILLRKSESFKSTRFPDLRYVTQAGGKLADVFIREFIQCQPDVLFYVMYGQTEATARLSYLPPDLNNSKAGSIGKGIPGVELQIVNGDGNRVLPGETGELLAKGDNIMMGYFCDQAETNQVIRNGWLHTGDSGTIDEEGYIYITGRLRQIVKVGGKRINPLEIESVILGIAGVIDCSVIGIEDDLLGEALMASLVITNGSADIITEEYVKRFCSEQLAQFKIPQVIKFSTELNLSATGKKIKDRN
jgi:long-chain acyl-CoA synthetase